MIFLLVMTPIGSAHNSYAQGVNQKPVAVDDVYVSFVDSTLNAPVGIGLLANDYDPDGDPISAVLEDNPLKGSVSINSDGSFIYTSNLGFIGEDRFTYAITDGKEFDLGVVMITISEEKITEIKSDVKNGVSVGPDEVVVISNGATVDGTLQVNGGTLVIKDDTTVNGNLESVGGTIKIESGSTITGNVQIKVSGAGGVLEIKDSTLFGNIISQDLDTLIIMNVNLGGNIISDNNRNVSITDNTVNGNIEIKGTFGSCTEERNIVNGNIDSCP